jgi:hypothetical protein
VRAKKNAQIFPHKTKNLPPLLSLPPSPPLFHSPLSPSSPPFSLSTMHINKIFSISFAVLLFLCIVPALTCAHPSLERLWSATPVSRRPLTWTASPDAHGGFMTPGGVYLPAECIFHVPDGTHIHADETHIHMHVPGFDETHIRVPRCERELLESVRSSRYTPLDESDGWQAYTQQHVTSGNITGMTSYWTVPQTPTEQAQLLYFFPGLQNSAWVPPQPQPAYKFDIIQPVLQFGYSPDGGGGYWAYASWYVTLDTNAVVSPLVNCSTGDVLFGNMSKMTSTDDSKWYVNAVGKSNARNSSIVIDRPRLHQQPFAFVTLEAYYVDDPGQCPGPGSHSDFTEIKLLVDGAPQTPQWQIGTNGQKPPMCNVKAKIIDGNDVSIVFP